jgi:NADH-quinone oxidoreductase subunit N
VITNLNAVLDTIRTSVSFFVPELILVVGIIVMIVTGLIRKNPSLFTFLAFVFLAASFLFQFINREMVEEPVRLFNGMLRSDDFSTYLRLLLDAGGLLTVFMTWRRQHEQDHLAEYYTLVMAVVVGSHLLVMSTNFIMVFISLELVSIGSYVLAGFAFTKIGTEGSLKYFLFGSVASALMLYGFTVFFGLTGTLDFSSEEFWKQLMNNNSPLFLMAGLLALAGFLYKIAAAPLHPWAPDVYEAAPMPVVAFFSVVPKLGGIGILTKFILAITLFGQSAYDWQIMISVVSILTLTVGNFSALWQKNPKRLMAYSSIAQSGFLLVGVAAFLPQGVQFMLFYATVYLLMNFLVFIYLQYFEEQGLQTIASFGGVAKSYVWPSIFLLIGLVALTGLPPTSGFTAKLFVFSALWESYQLSGKSILLWLFLFGLLNTVVSLFYYLRIPYYAFIKGGESNIKANILTFENLFGFLLVLLLLLLFFSPGLLMGWINKITFVL